jgi:hypothetical protein
MMVLIKEAALMELMKEIFVDDYLAVLLVVQMGITEVVATAVEKDEKKVQTLVIVMVPQ